MNFLQRIKDGAGRATEKAQHAVEINKLNSQIANIKHEMSVNYTEMGRIFYEGYRAQDMSIAEQKMMELSEACDELQDEINEIREKIALLKNERVCVCGHVSDLDANFCPKCGRSLTGDQAVTHSAAAKPEAAAAEELDETEEKEELFPDLLLTEDELLPDEDDYDLKDFLPEEKEEFDLEWQRRREEELQRERERQQELDERIRYWKENNESLDEPVQTEVPRDIVKCQICASELPKGSKWCPHCGAEQI
ncbi:zinc ribbon domain-containing protein [Neobacillus mesonae]|nr:zinc ribbon domain-containing protein [Neobacillus mesonae]